MSNIAVVTDSNSGITQKRAKELGVYVLPMSFFINGKQYFEDIDISQKKFFDMLADPGVTLSTSQPSPGEVTAIWDEALKTHDELVYIPMSSGLSASCQTASVLAVEYNGKVQVINNQRISVTLLQSVLDAKALADSERYTASDIKYKLESEKFESSIYIMVDTLKYLKKGGRITPAAALIGTVLNLKPVLQIQGEKLDAFAKCRGVKAAKKTMISAMHKDFENRFKNYYKEGNMALYISYTYAEDEVIDQWKREVRKYFPGFEIHGDPLSLSISCHTGPGCLAIACAKRIVP